MDDVIVGLHALRTFVFRRHHGQLVACPVFAMAPAWRNGTCIARCAEVPGIAPSPFPHSPPDERCSCGIYGVFSLVDVPKPRRFVAVMAAEGSTLVGEFGLRTAAARIVAHWGMVLTDASLSDTCDVETRLVPREEVDELFPDSQRYEQLGDMIHAYGLHPPMSVFDQATKVDKMYLAVRTLLYDE